MDPFSLLFLKLYHSQCTQSFITYTGFDYELFESLLLLFTPYFEQFTPYSDSGRIIRVRRGKGCKRISSASGWVWLGPGQEAIFSPFSSTSDCCIVVYVCGYVLG